LQGAAPRHLAHGHQPGGGHSEQQAEADHPQHQTGRVSQIVGQYGIGEVGKQFPISREGGEDQGEYRQTQQQGGGPAAGNPSKMFHESTEVDGAVGPI